MSSVNRQEVPRRRSVNLKSFGSQQLVFSPAPQPAAGGLNAERTLNSEHENHKWFPGLAGDGTTSSNWFDARSQVKQVSSLLESERNLKWLIQ